MTSGQTDTTPELFYEGFADEFDGAMNRYEVEKRLRLVFDDAFASTRLDGREFLDAGCGTGLFSAAATQLGAHITSLDVGERLLARVAEKCDSTRVVGDVQRLPFADASFDVVLCTEVIEHLPDPRLGVLGARPRAATWGHARAHHPQPRLALARLAG